MEGGEGAEGAQIQRGVQTSLRWAEGTAPKGRVVPTFTDSAPTPRIQHTCITPLNVPSTPHLGNADA